MGPHLEREYWYITTWQRNGKETAFVQKVLNALNGLTLNYFTCIETVFLTPSEAGAHMTQVPCFLTSSTLPHWEPSFQHTNHWRTYSNHLQATAKNKLLWIYKNKDNACLANLLRRVMFMLLLSAAFSVVYLEDSPLWFRSKGPNIGV